MQSHKNMILSDYLLTLTLERVIHLFPKSAWQNFICDPLASRLILVAVFPRRYTAIKLRGKQNNPFQRLLRGPST